MSYQVINPFIQFVDPINGKPLSAGSVYFGRMDSDPKNQPANRINVYAVQDNGSEVLLSQPVQLNGAGQPSVDGSVKQIKVELYSTEQAYAVQLFNRGGAQKGYTPRVYSALDLSSLADPSSTVVIAGFQARQLRLIDGVKNLIAVSNIAMQVKGFYAGNSFGGGEFYYDASASKATHNGGTIISPEALAAWDGTVGNIATLLNWTGSGTGCFIRVLSHDYLIPSWFGGTEASTNNAPMIQKCYDSAALAGLELKYDLMYPTTDTVNYNVENMCTSGVGQPRWRDASALDVGIQYNGTTSAPAILMTEGTSHHSWYKVRGTRNAAGAHNIQLGQVGVFSSCTIIDFVGISSQRAGGSGFAILGNNAGESCKWERGEASGCVGSGVYLARTDTSMNNTVFDKFNSHRNDADGMNLASGVQRLLIGGGCDFTLNAGAAIAFRASVDFDSVIENNWFENNDTDILLDCDTAFRGVNSRNNKLSEATTQAIYCKNGCIKSFGDKFNNTPIGVKFDVASGQSVVHVGQVASVTNMYSGDTSFLSHLPFEDCYLREYLFTINNVPAAQTNQVLPKVTGGTFCDVKPKMPFYRLRVRMTGVAATLGAMTINIVKNTATNRNNFFTTVIDAAATTAGSKETVVLFGNNTFVTSNNFDNFFLVYTTTADWNGTAGRVDVTVEVIDVL